ncbi:MAG: hypothetical protein LBT47_10950 [Deltaproteobacteria bacterium]|jgi:urease accessory protein|nr:hypothetical protein [Deltaproteobacteria bacterium]
MEKKSKSIIGNEISSWPLMYLSGSTLPLGAFSWSKGLETLCAEAEITDSQSLSRHLKICLTQGVGRLDLPILSQAFLAAVGQDAGKFWELDNLSLALRDTFEDRLEETEGGRAVARILENLLLIPDWLDGDLNYGQVCGFALLAAALGLGEESVQAVNEAWAMSFVQNQTAAAARCLPLGQGELQRILVALGPVVQAVSVAAVLIEQQDIGSNLLALSIFKARHERQRVRLFRS